MIIYFADRNMNILGQASTELPKGICIKNDKRTEELENGSKVLEFDLHYTDDTNTEDTNTDDTNTDDTREKVEKWADVGNYILRQVGEEQEFYTIIESELSVYNQRIYVYAEDEGMDLLNETVGAYTADKAYSAKYYIEKFSYDSGFEVGLNEISDLNRKLSWEGESTASARLLSIANRFDAEISYSFEINGMQIKHKYINLHKKRGNDNGTELRINREVNDIIRKKSVADLATGLTVTGGTVEGTEQPITLEGYIYDDGDFYVSGTCVFSRKALEKWSRYLSESGNDVGHIMQIYTYDTTSQSELCNRAIAKLKKICDASTVYEVELAYLPSGIKIGDTVNIIDDAGKKYISARIMKLEASESEKVYSATLGDYTQKTDGISEQVLELAAQFEKMAKKRNFYTWIVYADDNKGTNISTSSAGKEWIGIAYNKPTKEIDTTDPYEYSWSRITGQQGEPGKTSYLHIKYSNDGGKTFTANNGETTGDYIGQCTDFSETAPTGTSEYTWSKIKGEKGDTGKNGQMLYGTCDTVAGMAAKEVTLASGTLTLKVGTTVAVRFKYANTTSSPTINIAGTGAKAMYIQGVRDVYWTDGATVTFTYDGTNWRVASEPVYAPTAIIGNAAGFNVFIDGSSVTVRKGDDTLAAFLDEEIHLGKISNTARVYMGDYVEIGAYVYNENRCAYIRSKRICMSSKAPDELGYGMAPSIEIDEEDVWINHEKLEDIKTKKIPILLGSTKETKFVNVATIDVKKYAYFILCVGTSDMKRGLATTVITKDLLSYGADQSSIASFGEEPGLYKAECYFSQKGEVFLKSKSIHDCAKLYGIQI